jgi:hypothetical protein
MSDTNLDPLNQTTGDDGKVIKYYGDEKAYVWATFLGGEGPEPTHDTIEDAVKADSDHQVKAQATVEVGFFGADGGPAQSWKVPVPLITTDTVMATVAAYIVHGGLSFLLKGATPAPTNTRRLTKPLTRRKKGLQRRPVRLKRKLLNWKLIRSRGDCFSRQWKQLMNVKDSQKRSGHGWLRTLDG